MGKLALVKAVYLVTKLIFFSSKMSHVITNPASSVTGTKKAIIFDLDQTLVATQEYCSREKEQILTNPKFESLRKRMYDLSTKPSSPGKIPWNFWGLTRPHLQEFLDFAFSYFRVVGVWSAGTKDYVDEIVKFIFPEGKRQPHIVFTRDDIIQTEETEVGKPLIKLYNHNEVFQRYMNEKNTLIIDDNLTTSIYNSENIVHIPKYDPPCNLNAMEKDDIALLQLKQWLLLPEVRDSPDVTQLKKEGIFAKPLSPSSGYYYI